MKTLATGCLECTISIIHFSNMLCYEVMLHPVEKVHFQVYLKHIILNLSVSLSLSPPPSLPPSQALESDQSSNESDTEQRNKAMRGRM